MKTELSNHINTFDYSVRVYYEDTDAGGIVYHSNYLNFMERARTEWLRELGFEHDVLAKEWQVALVVKSIQIDYCKPARFNDLLQIHSILSEQARTYMVFEQSIWRTVNREPVELVVNATVKVACIHLQRFRPMAIPANIRSKLNRVD